MLKHNLRDCSMTDGTDRPTEEVDGLGELAVPIYPMPPTTYPYGALP
jgi:hypothetical protein